MWQQRQRFATGQDDQTAVTMSQPPTLQERRALHVVAFLGNMSSHKQLAEMPRPRFQEQSHQQQ
jgi:hypothetical protein